MSRRPSVDDVEEGEAEGFALRIPGLGDRAGNEPDPADVALAWVDPRVKLA